MNPLHAVRAWWRQFDELERFILTLVAVVVTAVVLAIVLSGCGTLPTTPPQPPTPPSTPTPPAPPSTSLRPCVVGDASSPDGCTYRAIAIVVHTQAGRPLEGAACALHIYQDATRDVWSENERSNAADGYLLWPAIDARVRPTDVRCAAPGYQPFLEHRDLYTAENEDIDPPVVMQPVHVDPSVFTDPELRNVRTDIAGVYLDEIRPQCPEDPVTHIRCAADIGVPRGVADGILFTANYRLYTADQRKVIRDVFTGKRPDSRGLWHHFTHLALSLFCRDVPDYHGVYPPCTTHAQVSLNDALHELLDDHLIPIGFVMHDDEPDDLATPLSVAELVDPSLVPLVTPYWEHYEVDCAMQKVRALFPKALLYYHNPTNTDAGYPDACYAHRSDAEYGALGGGRGWWQHFRDAYHGTGAFVQNEQGTVEDVRARLADFIIRFQFGFNSWPTGLDTVWFEDTNTVFINFWQGGDAAANERRADQVLVTPICGEAGLCGTLAGYASGSSK